MKILTVDDDRGSLFVLNTMQTKLGHDVIEAEDGESAWNIFQQQTPPLVITDWQMPKVDGLELCRLIRERKCHSYTYIILLTALSGRDNFESAVAAGADDFITKPFESAMLGARLHVAKRLISLKAEISELRGLMRICSYCKKIRTEDDEWEELDTYLSSHSAVRFADQTCPSCELQEG